MKSAELKPGVHWVGGIDWDIRNFHGYLTQRGTTYNAYLVIDEKTVLIDTVKDYLFDEMLSRIRGVVDPADIDYIVSNHVEMDHSGNVPAMQEVAPKARVITSTNGTLATAARKTAALPTNPAVSGIPPIASMNSARDAARNGDREARPA